MSTEHVTSFQSEEAMSVNRIDYKRTTMRSVMTNIDTI